MKKKNYIYIHINLYKCIYSWFALKARLLGSEPSHEPHEGFRVWEADGVEEGSPHASHIPREGENLQFSFLTRFISE